MSERAPAILLIHVHATDNAGDAALLDMALIALREALPEGRVTIAMNAPDMRYDRREEGIEVAPSFIAVTQPGGRASTLRRVVALLAGGGQALAAAWLWRLFRRMPPLPNRGLRRLLAQYAAADLVVSCPGNIFASTGKAGLPVLLSALTVAIGLALGKPLYVLPQSVGPLTKGWQRRLVGALYRRARVVMVREPVSLRFASSLGIPADRLHLVPDLAYAYPAAATRGVDPALLARVSALPRPIVGVTAINRLLSAVEGPVWDAYERGLAEGLAAFAVKRGGSVVFFPQVTGPAEREDDRIAARRIAAAMSDADSRFAVLALEEKLSPAELKALYAGVDLFVGTRMHSVIFATSAGVPTLCIEYLSKTRGLAEMMGLEGWVLDLREVTGDRLRERLDALWGARNDVRADLLRQLPEMADAARRAGALIRSDIRGR